MIKEVILLNDKLVKLFNRCLQAKYINTPESGNYSIEVCRNTIYVLFEWSNGAEDWKNNFHFLPTRISEFKGFFKNIKLFLKTIIMDIRTPKKPYKNMSCVWRCHSGFLKVYNAMKDDIKAKIIEILRVKTNIKNIVCVGYSHGGALSLLATEDLTGIYGESLHVSGYGFGAPRVIWGYVPKQIKARLKNYTVIRNSNDIVTHVPPSIFGFRDVGNMYTIRGTEYTNPIKSHISDEYINNLT